MAGVLLMMVALGVAGCGADSERAAHPGSSVGQPPKFSGVRHPLPTGRALRNDPVRYGQVRLTRCDVAESGRAVVAVGHAVNPTSHTVRYRVLVVFTDAQSRAVDSAVAKVTVAPRKDVSWTAFRSFDPPRGVRCVVRAVR